MPPEFTKSLAERLDSLSQVSVAEARGGERLEAGKVLIAPGGQHMTVRKQGSSAVVAVVDHPADTLYKPCVDVTINSVVDAFGASAMSVILTGMGNNGVIGVQRMRSAGGIVIAQDEASSVVYGMPRAVVDAGLAHHVSPLEKIVNDIVSYF